MVARARSIEGRNWELGDMALRIAPIGEGHGGNRRSSDGRLSLGDGKLRQFAGETDIKYQALRAYRHTSSRWPADSRLSMVSHQVHAELQALPDRFSLIRPGMTVTEARELAGKSGSARGGPPAATLVSMLSELAECRRRVQAVFRLAVPMGLGEGQKAQLLDDLTEIRFVTDQFYNYLAGESLDDTLEKILRTEAPDD